MQTVLVDPSVDTAVVGLTGWIIFKASTVKLPSILLLAELHPRAKRARVDGAP